MPRGAWHQATGQSGRQQRRVNRRWSRLSGNTAGQQATDQGGLTTLRTTTARVNVSRVRFHASAPTSTGAAPAGTRRQAHVQAWGRRPHLLYGSHLNPSAPQSMDGAAEPPNIARHPVVMQACGVPITSRPGGRHQKPGSLETKAISFPLCPKTQSLWALAQPTSSRGKAEEGGTPAPPSRHWPPRATAAVLLAPLPAAMRAPGMSWPSNHSQDAEESGSSICCLFSPPSSLSCKS